MIRPLILAAAVAASLQAAGFRLEVAAPVMDLTNAVFSVPVGPNVPNSGVLRSGERSMAFQKNLAGEIVFVASLKRGEAVTFTGTVGKAEQVIRSSLENGRVTVQQLGRTMFVYQGHETDLPRPDIEPIYKRGGYIHPVLTPAGKIVTDDFPPNHVHHHGIWFPWTKTTFEGRSPDFWNMGEGKGRVEFVRFGEQWSGAVHAGFLAHHRFVDLTSGEAKTVLNETWTVSAYALPSLDYFVFDLVSTQECATASALNLPKYHYGGLGFRGNWAWNGAEKTQFLTSNGETNRVKGNETRGDWCYISGMIDSARAGVAILSHPSNFRAPQGMRLHPSEPFMCFAPSQQGDWSIEPGKPYVSRYRFVVADGALDKAVLDTFWKQYSSLPGVKVVME